jgi:hypothetical protein
MKQRLIESLENPEILEQLYHENKQDFIRCFPEISKDINSDLVRFWKIRLASEIQKDSKGFQKTDLIAIIVLSIFTGLLVKLPQIFSGIDKESYYMRDLSIIIFNGIIVYTFWQNKFFDLKRILIYALTIIVLVLFLNLLPYKKSDSILLSLIHAPLFLWCLFGLSFISYDYRNINKRIEFIRFNGELIIMTGLILIAGGLLTGLTIGLFSAIKIEIVRFYSEYIVVFGCVAAPIISFYLIRLYPDITSKIAPVIARIFSPLVLITGIVYLISFIFSDSKILEDRELLILFNIMLLAVMAIIVFSVSELDKDKTKNTNVLVLFLLAILTIVINSIALIAIISRVFNGFTPNRTVVLVSNILIFINLIFITKNLYQSYFKNNQLYTIEKTVAKYLSIYFVWTVIVIFVLPFLYGMR